MKGEFLKLLLAAQPVCECIYVLNAFDFHRPACWIVESLSPTAAAVDAAPIRKLWPENALGSRPTRAMA